MQPRGITAEYVGRALISCSSGEGGGGVVDHKVGVDDEDGRYL